MPKRKSPAPKPTMPNPRGWRFSTKEEVNLSNAILTRWWEVMAASGIDPESHSYPRGIVFVPDGVSPQQMDALLRIMSRTEADVVAAATDVAVNGDDGTYPTVAGVPRRDNSALVYDTRILSMKS